MVFGKSVKGTAFGSVARVSRKTRSELDGAGDGTYTAANRWQTSAGFGQGNHSHGKIGRYSADDLDARIIDILEVNAGRTSEELGKMVGVSASTVRRHIARLIGDDQLKVIAIPNPKSEGHRVWVVIGMSVKVGTSARVANALIDHPSCYTVSECMGRYDVIVGGHFRSLDDVSKFVRDDLGAVGDVARAETIVLVAPRKYYGFVWRQ